MEKRATTTKSILCVAVILLYAPSGFAETATIVSSAPLYQHPAYDAPVIGQLNAGQSVELKDRSGGWKQVSTSNNGDKNSGWVRSYQVRTGEITSVKQAPTSGGFLSGLASLSRKASGLFSSNNQDQNRRSDKAVATIGVRGLSEEEIKNASPDFKEMEKMEGFRVSKKSAKNYAGKGQRTSIKLAHMPRSKVEE